MPVVISRNALLDLVKIEEYIARDRPMAAKQLGEALYRACLGLTHFPRRGRKGVVPGTRELTTVWPYLIIYEIWPDETVRITRIVHGARDRH